jgi:outer membrane protein insertion porin family
VLAVAPFLAAMTLAGAPAAAQQPQQIKVRSLTIKGAQAFSASRIKSVMSTAASGFWPWSRARYFDRRTFEADLDRITAFYADQGYPDARIASVDPALSRDQRSISLTITIDEGEPVRVQSIVLDGFDAALPNGTAALARALPIHEGDVEAVPAVNDAKTRATRDLQNNGYPHATVSVDRETVAAKRVRLVFTADTGAWAAFGDVAIQGNASVGDRVIDRMLAFHEGQAFSLAAVQQTQRRLYNLDLFQFATVEPALDNPDPAVVPVRVTVAEAKHRRVQLSGGWGTEEHLRGDISWTHLNFFGGARIATVEGKWSSLDRGVRTSFTQPYVFWGDTSLTVSGQSWFSDEPAYQLDTRGGRVGLTKQLTRPNPVSGRGATTAVSASVSYDGENFAISTAALNDLGFRDELIALGLDPRTGVGRTHLTALALDLHRTTTADPLNSTHGYLVDAHLEKGGGVLPGGYDYIETTAEVRHFLSLTPSLVFANRLRIGSLHASSPLAMNVPFFKRYFLGGATSLRGWGRFEVAPLSGSGLPLGGHSMLELSSELRLMNVYRSLGLVAFVDGGNAWEESWHVPDNLKWDAGPGLRYQTPVGPIRADLAFQLTPIPNLLVNGEPEKRHWRVQFSIGQAF